MHSHNGTNRLSAIFAGRKTAPAALALLVVAGMVIAANLDSTRSKPADAREEAIRGQIVATIKHPTAQIITDNFTGEQANALMDATTKRLDSSGFAKYSLVCKDGVTMAYRVFKPATVPGKTYPLVVYYNGAMNEGTDNVKQLMATVSPRLWALPEIQQRFPCYVAVPQLPANLGRDWRAKAAAEHKEVYDLIVKTYSDIDTKRVYLAGHSAGGSQVYNELSLYPEVYAAGLASDGTGDVDNWPAIYVAHHVALMAFVGGPHDPINPKRNGLVMEQKIAALGGKMTCVSYPNLDHWQVGNTFLQEPGVMDWLFAQHR
jgi:predicted peptidase